MRARAVCKDDLVWLPRPTATALGHIAQLALCSKVSNVVHVFDPFTLKVRLGACTCLRPLP